VRYKNIAGQFFGLATKHACDRRTDRRTDGRTDGRTHEQNYDSQDRASIAASRGNKRILKIIKNGGTVYAPHFDAVDTPL